MSEFRWWQWRARDVAEAEALLADRARHLEDLEEARKTMKQIADIIRRAEYERSFR